MDGLQARTWIAGPDALERGLLDKELARLPTGSYLAHYKSADTDAANNEAIRICNEAGAAPYRLRSVRQIVRFFDGFDIAEPGVVQSGPPGL